MAPLPDPPVGGAGCDRIVGGGAASQESALPELAQERTAAELADLLRSAPDRALALIRAALGKAATAAGVNASQARLALAVDQMEELFTTETEPASREAFVRLLATFAGSGLVWVIGNDPGGLLSPLRRSSGLLGAEGRPRQL